MFCKLGKLSARSAQQCFKENHDKGVTVHMSDGTTEEADILVGSDGIWSAVRAEMYNEGAVKARSEDMASFCSLQIVSCPNMPGAALYCTILCALHEPVGSRTGSPSKAAGTQDTPFLPVRPCWMRYA